MTWKEWIKVLVVVIFAILLLVGTSINAHIENVCKDNGFEGGQYIVWADQSYCYDTVQTPYHEVVNGRR